MVCSLLASANEDVREQAAWALGNISGDSVPYRDYVLSLNALPVLINVSHFSQPNSSDELTDVHIGV